MASGVVERCAECNGAFLVTQATPDDVYQVRAAARQGRYLAERVESIKGVTPVGHLASCSRVAS